MVVCPHGGNGLFVEPFGIKNGALIAGSNPFPDAPAGLFETAYGEIGFLCCGLV